MEPGINLPVDRQGPPGTYPAQEVHTVRSVELFGIEIIGAQRLGKTGHELQTDVEIDPSLVAEILIANVAYGSRPGSEAIVSMQVFVLQLRYHVLLALYAHLMPHVATTQFDHHSGIRIGLAQLEGLSNVCKGGPTALIKENIRLLTLYIHDLTLAVDHIAQDTRLFSLLPENETPFHAEQEVALCFPEGP